MEARTIPPHGQAYGFSADRNGKNGDKPSAVRAIETGKREATVLEQRLPRSKGTG
jgi:hypothetical protein